MRPHQSTKFGLYAALSFRREPCQPDLHKGDFDPARWSKMYQQLVDLKLIQHPIDPTTAYTTQFVGKQ